MSIEISDSAVLAYVAHLRKNNGDLKGAIAAAMGELLGEPVGWVPITDAIFVAPDFSVTTPMIYGAPGCYLGRKEKLAPLYAIKQGASRE